MPTRTSHIPELQALRGLAALIVALSHATNVYDLAPVWRLTLDTGLNAHAAVILFFVLSGYVLSASLMRSGLNAGIVGAFCVRRLFRIYPAVFAVTALALLVIVEVGSNPVTPVPSHRFVQYMLPSQLTPSNIALSFLTVRITLLTPVWTVFVELVASLILPALLWTFLRGPRMTILMLAVLALLAVLMVQQPYHLDALSYIFYFALGMTVRLFPAIWQRIVTPHAGITLILAAFLLLAFRPLWLLATTGELHPINFRYFAPLPAMVEGVFATVLIAAVVQRTGRLGWLSGTKLVAFGDISYSFYLVHFPIVVALGRTLSPVMARLEASGPVATAIVTLCMLLLTVPAAAALYRFVERPGMAVGAWLCANGDTATSRRKSG